jgi:hypothetical protein
VNNKLCSVDLRSQRGYSLTEVMVGGAILAGVALAGAQLVKDQSKAQKKIDLDQDLMSYHSRLAKLMAVAGNCNATFRTHLAGTAQPIAAGAMAELQLCNSSTSSCDDTAGMTGSSLANNAFSTGFYAGTRFVGVNDYISSARRWRVAAIDIPEARNRSGQIRIRVTYQESSGRRVSKELQVNARFQANGDFVECTDTGESFLKSSQQDLCKTMVFVNSSGMMATWDHVNQRCDFQLSKQCPAGSQSFLSSDGIFRCRKFIRPGDPSRLDGTSAPTCTPPLKPRVFFDSVSKTMDIRCE